jgi:hypothetical protein
MPILPVQFMGADPKSPMARNADLRMRFSVSPPGEKLQIIPTDQDFRRWP